MSLERITYRDPQTGRQRRLWATVVSDGPSLLLVTPLDSQGEDGSYYDAAGTLVEKQQLFSQDLVLKREPARQNPTYGTMEVLP